MQLMLQIANDSFLTLNFVEFLLRELNDTTM